MLNIAICDDDALHGRHTAAQISGLDGFAAAKLSLFTSADNLIYAITEDNYAVDIAVLDIQMESMDGIELAKRINEIAPECQIIFLSGHIEYASKVYDAEHVFFVLKSQSETYLKSALEKAVHRRESAKANYIVITNGANAQRMPWDKVQYLERVLRRTKVVTADGEYWTSAAPFQPPNRGPANRKVSFAWRERLRLMGICAPLFSINSPGSIAARQAVFT